MNIAELIQKYQGCEFITNLPLIVPCHCADKCYEPKGEYDDGGLYECELCKREVPYCFGSGDDFIEFCDDCAVMVARAEGIWE